MNEGATAEIWEGARHDAPRWRTTDEHVELRLVRARSEARELRRGMALLALWGSLVGGLLSLLATAVTAL